MIRERVPSILFVCTANIIRSPMAEALLKQKFLQSEVFVDWKVESAGVQGMVGFSADLNTQTAVEAHGLDLSKHIARRINRDLVTPFDLILTMEQQQKEAMQYAFRDSKDKIFFLAELAGLQIDIADPLSKPLEAYLKTYRTLSELLDKCFFQIILLSKYFSLQGIGNESEFHENGETFDVRNNVVSLFGKKPGKVVIEGCRGFSNQFCYKLMYLFLKMYPGDDTILEKLRDIASTTPPSDEDLEWLKNINYYAIAAPLTCRTKMTERVFIHPEIQKELDIIIRNLSDPTYQEIYQDLESLYRKNFPRDIYRNNIWDLTSKYEKLPYRVGDYEQAYVVLREKLF